ncbi:transcriptional regulator [Paraliobacillus sp. X-1268]|uniref:transcriptional regulator n=1 Tax=Paraliobacillus sp. X-1268 TaxID=2213193 RepID=UPI000E3DBB23|nr:transcriptional regulator [Paraliobacillus sp. X-1268]
MHDIKITKSTFKKVEAEWFNYYRTLDEIKLIEDVILHPYKEVWEQDDNTGGGKNNIISNPTEATTIRLTKHKQLNHLREVTSAIETVYKELNEERKKLVHIRYWSKRKLVWDRIAEECYVSRRQAINWRDEIIQATVEVLGWR